MLLPDGAILVVIDMSNNRLEVLIKRADNTEPAAKNGHTDESKKLSMANT